MAHYRDLLTKLFPHEKKAIRRYCQDVKRAYSWMSLRYMADMVPPLASPAIHLAILSTCNPRTDQIHPPAAMLRTQSSDPL